jgi:hypothetical protein
MFIKNVIDFWRFIDMKNTARNLIVTVLCLFFVFSLSAGAERYTLSGTDMSITINDEIWYVFTRDNILNNPEMDELGLEYDYMYDTFHNNNAYVDAVLFFEDNSYIELLVRKNYDPSNTKVANLSNYTDKEVLSLVDAVEKNLGGVTAESSVYKTPSYKFGRLDYVDPNFGYYICEFYTIINREFYTITFQATSEYTDEEYLEIESIVDSVVFDVDESLKEVKSGVFDKAMGSALKGAIVGGIGGLIGALIVRKKKKAKASQVSKISDVGSENSDFYN